jgi:hypothetical protein
MPINPASYLSPGVFSEENVLGIFAPNLEQYSGLYLIVNDATAGSTTDYVPIGSQEEFEDVFTGSTLGDAVAVFFNVGGYGLRCIRAATDDLAGHTAALNILDRDIHPPGIIAAPGVAGFVTPADQVTFQGLADAKAVALFSRYHHDIDPLLDTAAEIVTERNRYASARGQTMIYFPWMNGGTIPPSIPAAGVTLRVIRGTGLGNAGAGQNYPLSGVSTLDTVFDRDDADILNPIGVNLIRQFRNRGIVVYGFRTISNEPAFVSGVARQVFDALGATLETALEPEVFRGLGTEGELLQDIQTVAEQVCFQAYEFGWLYGTSPQSAFRVVCSPENNSDLTLENLAVIVDVYARPSPFAEKIIVNRVRVSRSLTDE